MMLSEQPEVPSERKIDMRWAHATSRIFFLRPLVYKIPPVFRVCNGTMADECMDAPITFREVLAHIRTANAASDFLSNAIELNPELAKEVEADTNSTLLHYSAQIGRDDFVILLISGGASPGARNSRGENAAHIAFSKGYSNCASTLLDAIEAERKDASWIF
jgi:hypothetical protein